MATRLSEENKRLLKKWEIERKEERKSLELYRARCTADKTEMYQLLGFYIVFQGVVFNTVATSQKLTCQTSALPAVLSLLVLTGTAISVHFKLTDYESDKRRLINSENIEESAIIAMEEKQMFQQELESMELGPSVFCAIVGYEILIGLLYSRVSFLQYLKNKKDLLESRGDQFDFKGYTLPKKKPYPKLGKFYAAILFFLAIFSLIIMACCVIIRCWDVEKGNITLCFFLVCWEIPFITTTYKLA